jgi:hypothetical protein
MPNFLSKTFTQKQSTHNNLSIQADLNGFCFCVSDPVTGHCHALKNFRYTITDYNDLDNEIHRIFQQEDLLKINYKNSYCLFLSDKSALIPSTLFNTEHLRTYLEFVAPLDDLDEIHFHQIASIDAMDIFAIPSPLANVLNMYQRNTIFYHQSIPVIRLLNEQQPHNGILMHLSHKLASFALCAERRLVLSNTFHTETFTDALYYLCYIIKQWHLTPENTTVYLSGQLLDDDMELLSRYYPMISGLYNAEIADVLGRAKGMEYQLLPLLCSCE